MQKKVETNEKQNKIRGNKTFELAVQIVGVEHILAKSEIRS